jgi:hypothetical protein
VVWLERWGLEGLWACGLVGWKADELVAWWLAGWLDGRLGRWWEGWCVGEGW